MKYVAVTGCAGFIGRVVTRQLLERGDYVYGVDALTYAADPDAIAGLQRDYPERFRFVAQDIRALGRWPDVDAVLHLAAETHVDNSLDIPTAFVETNVAGTAHLLEMTRRKRQQHKIRFIYVSTDEVYGDIAEGVATADSPLRPSSPYAASKAAADLLVQAWGRTYGIEHSIIRPSNAYGAGQYVEKLIPKTIRSALLGRPIPIHGDGEQVRQWLWVEDAASAILFVLDHANRLPTIVNVDGNATLSVNSVVAMAAYPIDSAFRTARAERPGQDMRYAVDDSPLRRAGWIPTGDFWRDLPGIVAKEREIFRF